MSTFSGKLGDYIQAAYEVQKEKIGYNSKLLKTWNDETEQLFVETSKIFEDLWVIEITKIS